MSALKVLYCALKVDCALHEVLTLTQAMGIETLLTAVSDLVTRGVKNSWFGI